MSDQGPPPGARQGRPPAGRAPAKKTAARPPAGRPPSGGESDQQTLLGGALIGLAVLIGLVLLVKGFSDDDGSVAAVDPDATSTSITVDRDAAPTVDPSETTTTTSARRDPASVNVLVANGSGVSGVAGQTAEALGSLGYTIVDTANASPVSATQVLYAGEAEADALGVAEALGLDAAAVAPVPDPPPVPDLAGADVVVIVGPDLAAGPITVATTSTTAAAGGDADGATTTTAEG